MSFNSYYYPDEYLLDNNIDINLKKNIANFIGDDTAFKKLIRINELSLPSRINYYIYNDI